MADRIAQTVVRGYLEPGVEPVFHADSFAHWRWGVRPDGWTMGAR